MDAVSSTALLGNWAGGATGSLSQSLPGQPCQGPSPGSSSPATWLSEQGPVPPLRPLLLACGSGTGRPQLALCALIASPPAAELLAYTPRTNSAIPPYVLHAHTRVRECPHVLRYTLRLLFGYRTYSSVLGSVKGQFHKNLNLTRKK